MSEFEEIRSLLVKPAKWHNDRCLGIGGSDAGIIMRGFPDELLQLWRIKRGEEDPPDLSGILPVAIGTITEPLNRYWYTRTTGRGVYAAGKTITSAKYPWMRAGLDGLTTTERLMASVFEAKHVNAWSNIDEVIQVYQPQCHHLMITAGVEWCVLSILIGTQKYEWIEVPLDPRYASTLVERERAFWECVVTVTPPAELPPVPAPVPPTKWRTIDLTGNNAAAVWAPEWLECREPAKRFATAERELKSLLEPDVGLASGYGITIRRDKAGRLRITEQKE